MSVYGADTSVSRWRAQWPADTVGRSAVWRGCVLALLGPAASGSRCGGVGNVTSPCCGGRSAVVSEVWMAVA